MSEVLELSLLDARRLAVKGQRLSGPRPTSILETVEELGWVQMDPVRPVARTEQLVLWGRLGSRFRVRELERLLWEERSLFEYRAFIVPTSSFGVHRETMRRYPNGPGHTLARRAYTSDWLKTNAPVRREVLRRLRSEGPLRTREFTTEALEDWKSRGWNDEKSISVMLETLWAKGEVMVVGREHQERVWDLAERRLPVEEPRLPAPEVARRILDAQVRALGVASTKQFGWAFDGRPPGWERRSPSSWERGGCSPRASRASRESGTPTPRCLRGRGGPGPRCSVRSISWCTTATGPMGSSTSSIGWRCTCPETSGSTGTTCCRSSTGSD